MNAIKAFFKNFQKRAEEISPTSCALDSYHSIINHNAYNF